MTRFTDTELGTVVGSDRIPAETIGGEKGGGSNGYGTAGLDRNANRVSAIFPREVNLANDAILTAPLDVGGDTMRLRSSRTPASSSAPGNEGDICFDANYAYHCVATNTWKRVAMATW